MSDKNVELATKSMMRLRLTVGLSVQSHSLDKALQAFIARSKKLRKACVILNKNPLCSAFYIDKNLSVQTSAMVKYLFTKL